MAGGAWEIDFNVSKVCSCYIGCPSPVRLSLMNSKIAYVTGNIGLHWNEHQLGYFTC